MASLKIFLVLFLVYLNQVESASLFERSYEYVMNIGKNLAPSFMTMLDCMGEEDVWGCAKTKAGILLDTWGQDLNKQRRSWQELADAEVTQSGRSYEELPSKLGREVEGSLSSLAEIIGHGAARAFTSKKHHESGGIDTITISTGADKKKEKKKKQKPPKIHLVQMPVMKMEEKGREIEEHVQKWVIGHEEHAETRQVDVKPVDKTERHDVDVPRGFMEDAWALGEKTLDSMAEHALESDNVENGLSDKSSLEEQRGKKKKKKKAILKLLLLGAVLKAKIGTLLQILSFKLQVKFFIIALLGLAINLARFWLDVKKSHHQQPQKVIYYEHAQHQHHYDEHEEAPGWGPWSRSMEPPEQQQQDVEIDLDLHNTPYRAQERIHLRDMRPVPSDI